MDDILQDGSPAALAMAGEENMFTFFRNSTEAEVHDEPDLLWWITDQPFAYFNMLFRANLAPERVDAAIEVAIARAGARKVSLVWWVGPATRPPTLGQSLQAHGFAAGSAPGMAADLDALADEPPVAGLAIERVSDEEARRRWCHIFTQGYGMPEETTAGFLAAYAGMDFAPQHPLRYYLGWLEGVPVATSALCLAAGVAGLYCIATLPAFRGRGIGAAMTLAPLREAQAQGYRTAILQSSEKGFPVYTRLGFRQYCTLGVYIWRYDGGAAG
jgi:ribosomal protein S18 acetylase RimI-like enzyme